MYYKKTKKEKKDICNICLEDKLMTWDHVPPRPCQLEQQISIDSFFGRMTGKVAKENIVHSNNGLKYRTLCADCNSTLGSHYDKELIFLTHAITSFLFKNRENGSNTGVVVKIKPIRLIKSLVGHILASKKQLDNSQYDSIYREFFFSKSNVIPAELNIFYWYFPYGETVVMRDFVMPRVRGKNYEPAFFNLLKFFPFAFLFCDQSNYQNIQSLTSIANGLEIDDEIDFFLNLSDNIPIDWPERVDEGNFILGSRETQNSIITNARRLI